ncbi:MAG: FAD-binding oxidoreductase [Betaproteobacteria bacterium]|nr:MAG: FAD-binding oxidoreductase [Betaproteobacteria bacterium]
MKISSEPKLTTDSYYEASVVRPLSRGALMSEMTADVCVVGGGLAGLSAALELRQRGYSVAVLEAKHTGWGASGRNGGQVIAGLACDIAVIEKQLGFEAAKRVWNMTLEAIDLIHERRAQFKIHCDWQAGYLNGAVNAKKGRALAAWVDDMQKRYGYEQQFISQAEVRQWIDSPKFVAMSHDPRSGHLHPLKYTLGMAKAAESLGATICENTAVTGISPATATSDAIVHSREGSVRAKHVLLAGNVYLDNVAPALKPRIMPVGTYIVASAAMDRNRAQSLIPSRAAICDTNFVLDYFRLSADDRMIFGGRVSYSAVTPMNLAPTMRERMLAVFPQLDDVAIEHAWGGFVDITMNRAPDFGRAESLGKNVYYLQGFSGHGLALTGLAGKLVAEAIAGNSERFDTFASLKHRAFPGGGLLRTPALVAAMAWYRLRDRI